MHDLNIKIAESLLKENLKLYLIAEFLEFMIKYVFFGHIMLKYVKKIEILCFQL